MSEKNTPTDQIQKARKGLSTTSGCHKKPSLTLRDRFEKFRVSDDLTLLHLLHAVRLLGLTPEIGASVHAGYIEDSYALQRHAA